MKRNMVGYLPKGWDLKTINLWGKDQISPVKLSKYNKHYFREAILDKPYSCNIPYYKPVKVRITIEEIKT